ncbi:major facilitator superfamily domain-containing protein [Sphaerosporella brunnea]|uniref:Major facilitator superfamily domain-containing protein n=1 Tax=Sphaerosporella brunnea TaxID=1250544 RepID=A0A5J5F5C5_9PEZI|nr:major facilitator superfamily domain-containing protein [Sphaerosporella brunnea]
MSTTEKMSTTELEKALPGQSTPVSSSTEGIEKEWTEAEEKILRNRVDWYIIPLVTFLYLLCFLDRANIGNARIQGMQEDLFLEGFRFNWALTIFYIPYLLVEIPSNIALKHVGAKIFIPFLVFGFGFCSMCTAFVRTHTQLYVARAFLGFFEGGTMPGIAYFLSNFYRRGELMFRIGILLSASSMSGAFGGLLATGLARIPKFGLSATPLHSWRNIFFFEGLATMVIALICYFYMYASPETCKFLTPRQRYIAIERIQREHRENQKEKTQLIHVKRGILNINNLLCAVGFFLNNISVQSFALFMPTILKALGWTSTKAQLLTVPPYILAATWSIFVSWLSDRYKKRGLFASGHSLCAIVGYAIIISTDRAAIKYMGVFFGTLGCYPLGPIFLSWGLNNAAGPTIRAVSSGFIVSFGTFGSIIATWTYLPADAPKYRHGHTINLAAQSAAALTAVIGILYCRWENNKRARGERDHRISGLSEEEARKLGYRHPEFRYIE